MQILVTGCEGSGNKMMAGILSRAGAGVTHHSPTYAEWDGQHQPFATLFDAVIVIVRDGFCVTESLIESGHLPVGGTPEAVERRARIMQGRAMDLIYSNLGSFGNVYEVTYENYVGRGKEGERRMRHLLDSLGLDPDIDLSDLGDANAKYYGGEHFHDDRESYERQ
jgi:hypothetical protein